MHLLQFSDFYHTNVIMITLQLQPIEFAKRGAKSLVGFVARVSSESG